LGSPLSPLLSDSFLRKKKKTWRFVKIKGARATKNLIYLPDVGLNKRS